ncbi:MAG TPA: DUF2141 domain-containing protein [Allosphingosinicella sp.]|jgi:uncharacterized protein (DUF2141 family)
MKTTLLAALIAALAAPAGAHAAPAGSSRLTLTFETGAATGAVLVALFDSKAAYDGGAPVRQARVDVAKGERIAIFANLASGDYAMKAFHDLDGDGRMTTNPFGRPIEPFAFSNNARGNMGPAAWDRARLKVAADVSQIVEIR